MTQAAILDWVWLARKSFANYKKNEILMFINIKKYNINVIW
jgi:hypothetical protein